MRDFEKHLNDEDLLLAIDGELPGPRAKQVEEHLAACWDCRARKQDLEKTIGNFVEARHAEFDSQVQPSAGLRAMLRANLEQIAARPAAGRKGPRGRIPIDSDATRGGCCVCDGCSRSHLLWVVWSAFAFRTPPFTQRGHSSPDQL